MSHSSRIPSATSSLMAATTDDDVAARNVVAARTAFDAAKDMWCAAKEALEAAIDDKKKKNGARKSIASCEWNQEDMTLSVDPPHLTLKTIGGGP